MPQPLLHPPLLRADSQARRTCGARLRERVQARTGVHRRRPALPATAVLAGSGITALAVTPRAAISSRAPDTAALPALGGG